jgi:hypothetical protein
VLKFRCPLCGSRREPVNQIFPGGSAEESTKAKYPGELHIFGDITVKRQVFTFPPIIGIYRLQGVVNVLFVKIQQVLAGIIHLASHYETEGIKTMYNNLSDSERHEIDAITISYATAKNCFSS